MVTITYSSPDATYSSHEYAVTYADSTDYTGGSGTNYGSWTVAASCHSDEINEAIEIAYQKYLHNKECLAEMAHIYKPPIKENKHPKPKIKYFKAIQIAPGIKDKRRNKRKSYIQKLNKKIKMEFL